jgi:hypothetical protein
MTRSSKVAGVLVGCLALLALGGSARATEVVAGVTATCPATGPGVVVCGTVGVVMHELILLASGKEGFGPNGEIMKVLVAPVKIVDGNFRAASRERGEMAKALRATTGISVEDIGRYGVFGGPNSIFRKPFG